MLVVVTVAGLGAAAVVAVVATDGREERDVDWDDPRAAPSMLATDGEVVCTLGDADDADDDQDDMFCLELDGGFERFAVGLDGDPATSPTIVGDTVLFGTGSGIHAYTLDGEEAWSNDTRVSIADGRLAHLPVAGDTAAVLEESATGDVLVGLDVATGDHRWRLFGDEAITEGGAQTEISSLSQVLTDGERFYVTTETTPPFDPSVPPSEALPAMTLVAIDPSTGTEAWRWTIQAGSTSFPFAPEVALLPEASAAAFVIEEAELSRLVVLDTATGELRWEVPLVGSDPSVAYADGVLVVADGRRTRGYDVDGGELWSAQLPDRDSVGSGGLVVTGGRLFLVPQYGLVEIDPTDGTNRSVEEGTQVAGVLAVAGALVISMNISSLISQPLPAPL